MGKYIDAYELLKLLNACRFPADRRITKQQATYNAAMSDACRRIDAMPAADVVAVVRCKDCKHFDKWHTEVTDDTGYYCTRPNQQTCNLMPEDYCSYGERKNG